MFRITRLQVRRRFPALIFSFGVGCGFLAASIPRSSADPFPQWKQIGPSPLIIDADRGANGIGPDAGMVRDIAIDPRGTSDQTIYVATDNGGIWKTTDGGNSWSPKTDFMPSLNMGSIALDPGNQSIVYAGTGNELSQNRLRQPPRGVGIYKSMNGGDSWPTILGEDIFTNVAINRIVLPASNILLVATSNGVYRSIDGGVNFGDAPLFNNNRPIITGDVTDLDVDTVTATTIYASISGAGVFRSINSGETFPDNRFTATNGAPTNFGFIAFAQSTQPNGNTMYANVALFPGQPTTGIFKSTDSGANWSRITASTGDNETGQVGYAQTVGVDPQDANRAYFGFRALYMVTDGGASGVTAGNRIDLDKVHADQHALMFSPPGHRPGPAPTRFYNGTDGGIATNPDGGINNWTPRNGSDSGVGALATILFRQIDIGRGTTANNAYTYGVAQDLGISSRVPGNAGISWHLGVGGDGWAVAVDPNDPRHAKAMGGSFVGTADGTSWQAGGTGVPSTTQPLYFDPNGGTVFALVNNQLLRSTDNGATFSVMRSFAPTGNALMAINMVKLDSKTIWLGESDGTVWHTSTANNGTGATWVNTSIPGAPGQAVRGIAIDPTNVSQVVVVYPTGEVFRTLNNGVAWNDITGNLPISPLNAVVIDPNTSPHAIIVASNNGVMQTTDGGTTWEARGGGLPAVQCTSLAIDSTAIPSLLRVGTYGRSAFELNYDRLYVNGQAPAAGQDGTREHPFLTIKQALNVPTTGGTRYINIQAGTYTESQNAPITQACTLNAINGFVTIH